MFWHEQTETVTSPHLTSAATQRNLIGMIGIVDRFYSFFLFTQTINWLDIISVMEITCFFRGLSIWCYIKWADVFVVFCTKQILSSFPTGVERASPDSRRARWTDTRRCCLIGLHNCNMKTNSPNSPLLYLCLYTSIVLHWSPSQFSLESNTVYCWLTSETLCCFFSKSKLVMWTKDGSPINSVCRGFRELSPKGTLPPPSHHIKVLFLIEFSWNVFLFFCFKKLCQ